MKKVMQIVLIAAMAFFLTQCGGPKKMTQDEINQMPPQERITYLEKYVEKNPNNLEMKKELYKTYLETNMPDRAVPIMKDIINTDPYQAEVQFDYGNLMMKKGETQLAYRAFRDALKSPGGSMYSKQVSQYLGGKFVVQQVTSGQANEAFPCFSPDGSKIIYQTDANGNWDIVEQDLASGTSKFLVDTPADEELPNMSPDGKSLVYTSNADDRRPIDNKFKVREIYLKELETGFVRNLTESVADDWLPRFSHDGKYIVFVSERSDLRSVPYTEKKSDIYVMDADGAFQLRLTEDDFNDGGPCYTYDDARIYFHSNRNGPYQIFSMKADGSSQVTVFGMPGANAVGPYTSPDSVHLAFFSDQDGNYDIYRAELNGSNIERLTYNAAKDTDPVYSPDGKSLAFQSNRNGNYDIFLLNFQVSSEPSVQELISRLDKMVGQ